MYSVRVNHRDVLKKAKGVKKCVLKKKITFGDYKNCIENLCIIKRTQNSIRSIKHNVFSIQQDKIALNPFDDKRCIMDDGINNLPWGHYSLN